jgi:protein-S-isoprenylcysteine O-methyltransferase Ste14
LSSEAIRRVSAIVGTVFFLLIAPGTVAGFVPWWISGWRVRPPLLHFYPFRWLGIFLIVAGVPLLLDSFVRFALKRLGTPAPVFPTRYLVLSGLYRYARNPMYVAVVAVIVGQGLSLGMCRFSSTPFFRGWLLTCLSCSMRSRRGGAALGPSMKPIASMFRVGFPA